MKKLFHTVLTLLLIGSGSVFAAPEEKEAPDPLRAKAQNGDAEACFQLGNEYFYGENRKRNPVLASHWYHRAAEKGIVEAMFNYGICLEGGHGQKADAFEAGKWYRKAAEKDYDPARFRLAALYAVGIRDSEGKTLLRKSPASALEQLEILNSHGFEAGELELARILLAPLAGADAKKRAFAILRKVTARKTFSPAALRMLADCYYAGYGCKKDPEKMLSLLAEASKRGDSEATAKLGFFHENGTEGLAKNPAKAFALYREAAEAGHPMAQFKYAEALFAGRADGKAPDPKKAVEWLEKSAAGDCPQAMHRLGVIYYEGLGGFPVNKAISARCFFEGAKRGFAPSQYNFGCLFADGEGVKQDDAAAFYWFTRAAERNHAAAQRRLGLAFLEGKGVDRNRVKAREWLILAAKNGDTTALRLLETMR